MKLKNKKIFIFIIVLIITLGITTLKIYNSKYKKVLYNVSSDQNSNVSSMYAVLLETGAGSGIYEEQIVTTWPTTGYSFNSNLSYCVNGSELSYNATENTVSLIASGSDKCYVYFDIVPPDVYVATSGTVQPYNANYTVTSSCTSSSSVFNLKDWSLDIDFSANTSCTINYTEKTTSTLFSTYIKNLAGTTQGTGQLVNEYGYRYEGKNPNNYVWFNNEMWRVIGVFGNEVHGQSSDLVKLIKMDTIGGLVWNTAEGVTWSGSSLKNLLDNYYYNGTDYPYNYSSTANACSSYSGYTLAECNYSQNGITNTTYRNMIQNVRWNNTAFSSIGTAASTYASDIITTTTSTGYVGLMYISDYGFGPLASTCARTINLGSYYGSTNGLTCTGQNWLFGKSYEWTMSQYSTSRAWYVNSSGRAYNHSLYFGRALRPVLFLKSGVYYLDGDGSYNNPFVIGL